MHKSDMGVKAKAFDFMGTGCLYNCDLGARFSEEKKTCYVCLIEVRSIRFLGAEYKADR
jgi:hypothetical protein